MLRWRYYLTDNIPKDEFTQELDEKVRDINKDPQWRKQYMDLAYKMKEIRLEGREEGREEGKKEGMIKAMIDLVNAKLLAPKDAAEHLGFSEEAFMKLMNQS